MIEASTSTPQITIYTDHSAMTSIVKQTELSSNSTDKLNLRLVRASTYLPQFRLDVRHKPGKQHIVPDALSRLQSSAGTIARTSDPSQSEGILDMAYHVTLVEMSEDFKTRLKDAYRKNKRWARMLELLKPPPASEEQSSPEQPPAQRRRRTPDRPPSPAALERQASTDQEDRLPPWSSAEGLRFRYRDGLLYYVNELDDGHERLCIPRKLAGEVFALAHDRLGHAGYHKT